MIPLLKPYDAPALRKDMTIEDAERVTRIPRGISRGSRAREPGSSRTLADARGFLRSTRLPRPRTAGAPPVLPLGHVEEPRLDPLPEVREPRTWTRQPHRDGGSRGPLPPGGPFSTASAGRRRARASPPDPTPTPPSSSNRTARDNGDSSFPPLTVTSPTSPAAASKGSHSHRGRRATYIVVSVQEGDVPVGQVIATDPGEGQEIPPATSSPSRSPARPTPSDARHPAISQRPYEIASLHRCVLARAQTQSERR